MPNPYQKAAEALTPKPKAAPVSKPSVSRPTEKNPMQRSIEKMSPSDVDEQNRRAIEFANRNKRTEARPAASRFSRKSSR